MEKEICIICGSDKIQGNAWVEINTGVVLDYIDNEVWCPECEDDATDYYTEKYIYTVIPEPIDPNQLSLNI